jgi:DNA replication protein DnaC
MMMEHSSKLEKLQLRVEEGIRSTKPLQEALEPKTMNCTEHGEYVSTGARYMGSREIWSRCPDCHERMVADERRAEAEKQALYEKNRMEAQLEQALIPARFIGRSFDNFVADNEAKNNALSIVRGYVTDFETNLSKGRGLVLSGMPGTGKSHLAIAALQEIMPEHVGLYTTCMNVIRAIRQTWRKDAELSETEILNIYSRAPLLVLDEIGVQYGTDGEQTILFDVLDRRYRDMMPTIILTNQDKKGFKDFIGDRSFDRLVETSRWVTFDWESYRATARKEAQ